MKSQENFEYTLIKKITKAENRREVKKIILQAFVWVCGIYASMYGFLYLFLWVMKS